MEHEHERHLSDDQLTSARLKHLSDIKDFKVADGDPDIRGWGVRTSDGIRLGKVVDLLVDTSAMKVRYMDVAIDKKLLDLDDDRHVLVPIGTARLNDDEDVVQLNLAAGDLTQMPTYERGTITINDERVLYDRYAGAQSGDVRPNDNLYDNEYFDDRPFRSTRSPSQEGEYLVREREYVVRPEDQR